VWTKIRARCWGKLAEEVCQGEKKTAKGRRFADAPKAVEGRHYAVREIETVYTEEGTVSRKGK